MSFKVPKSLKLKDGTDVKVSHMHDNQLVDAYRLLQLPEVFDEGFGVGTYTDEATFCDSMSMAKKRLVQEKITHETIAYVMVHDSRFNRGVLNADTLIIVRPEHLHPPILDACLTLALGLARASGFRGLYVDTFATNEEVLKVIDGFPGFEEVAKLPSWTLDHRDVTSVIFFNKLDLRTEKFSCCI